MPIAKKKRGYSARDLAAVSDSPEWTEEDFARARPFAEVLPRLAKSIRRGRGPNKAPTKKLVSLRLSPEVIAHFKSQGPGWQSRIDDTLRKAAKLKAGQIQSGKRAQRR
jgi:uncharacterized protein (DUF4415 family)